jgi:transcriptional regulator with XRE-family HTH domain
MANYEAIGLFRDMEPNQALFVHHLRTNPHDVVQIQGNLVDDSGHMCALGLGLEAFDMIAAYKAWEENEAAYPGYDPYNEISNVLNMPKSHVCSVYNLNDDYDLSFSEIASIMEEYFKQDDLFAWNAYSPEAIWDSQQNAEKEARKEDFTAKWKKLQTEHSDFLYKAAAVLGVGKYELEGGVFDSWDADDFFSEYVENDDY